jgi:hypothetical protein
MFLFFLFIISDLFFRFRGIKELVQQRVDFAVEDLASYEGEPTDGI